jgi:Tfp pilus assembly protein PilO
MKGFLKMSGRDRNLLILLLAAVIFYLCYTFVMIPFMAENEILQMELQTIDAELARAAELSGKEDEMKEQEAVLKEDITKKYSAFLTDIKQSRILYKVDSLAVVTALPISSYLPSADAFSPVNVEKGFYIPPEYPLKNLAYDINPTLLQDDAAEETAPQPAPVTEDMIPGTDISIAFGTAPYESVYQFIGEVEKLNKTAFLRSIDLTGSGGTVQGQMIFSFYSLPRFDSDQKDGFDFIPVIPAGKANPFN